MVSGWNCCSKFWLRASGNRGLYQKIGNPRKVGKYPYFAIQLRFFALLLGPSICYRGFHAQVRSQSWIKWWCCLEIWLIFITSSKLFSWKPFVSKFKYTINAKAEGLWQIKTVIKTEAQPRFLWAVFICHKPEAEAFIVFRFNPENVWVTFLCLFSSIQLWKPLKDQRRFLLRPVFRVWLCCTCVEEDRSRFHGSQHRLSQSVVVVHGEAARAARMRSAWMSGWGWELFWTLNNARFPGSTYASSTAALIDEPKTHAPSFFLSFSLALRVVRFAFLLWCHVSFGSFVVQGRTGQVDCRSDPEKNCSSHGLLVTQLPKVRSRVEECARPSGIVEGKDRRSPGMLFRGRQDERWWHVQPQFVCVR